MYTSPLKKTTPAASRTAELGEKNGRTLPAVPVLQNKPVQKMAVEEEEPLQAKSNLSAISAQPETIPQFAPEKPTLQKKENNTGLPDNLKEGVENLSGIGMDDVSVHYNSDKPAQLNALAFAQGTDIHVGPGQEKHLPHEAWHVIQQKQGRVQPTMQMNEDVAVNDSFSLEQEADVMGFESNQGLSHDPSEKLNNPISIHSKTCSCPSCNTQTKINNQQSITSPISPSDLSPVQLKCAICQSDDHDTLAHIKTTGLAASPKHIKGNPGKGTKASQSVMNHAKAQIESNQAAYGGEANKGNDYVFEVKRQHRHKKTSAQTRKFNVHKGGGNGSTKGYYMQEGQPSDSDSSDDE